MDTELTVGQSVLGALVTALVLAGLHLRGGDDGSRMTALPVGD